MKKLSLLLAAGAGYVLGTKAGRERYDQIRGAARKVRDNPRVQRQAHRAADVAREQAPVVRDKVTHGAHVAAEKVRSVRAGSETPDAQ